MLPTLNRLRHHWADRWPVPDLGSVVVAWLVLGTWAVAVDSAEPAVDFSHDVAPIFEHHCIRCHQPSNKQGDLSLSTIDDLASKDYIDRERPADSYLLELVTASGGARPQMPKEGTVLTADEVATLRRWVAAGAPWPKNVVVRERAKADRDWWSLRPLPAKVEPPSIAPGKDADPQWSQNPIDRFVLAKLREKGLQPSPRAEKATLIRRATYDLTGLPPTPEEIAAFVADESPDAYEQLVDRLLASPHYGERWGRHWLDVIRFGESRGYERNLVIDNLWPFRDYVIRSFNSDKPFNQFIREHLAGDIIGKNQPEVEVGAAFLVAGPYDDVGNNDPVAKAQIRADTLDEMIRATSEAFLGLTVGCARCHNHKFDPILQSDYYSLYSTFAGVVHGERPVATAAEHAAHSAKLAPLTKEQERLNGERQAIEKELQSRVAAREAEVAKTWTRERTSRYGTEERFTPVEARYVRLRVEGNDGPTKQDAAKYAFRIDEFEIWSADPEPRNVALATAGGRAEGAAREAKNAKGVYGAGLVNDGRFGERWIAGGKELRITLAKPERIDRVYFSSDRARALDDKSFVTTFVGDYRLEVSLDGQKWTEVANSFDRLPQTPGRKRERLLQAVTTDEDRARFVTIDRKLAAINKDIERVPALPVWWVGKRQTAPGPFHAFVGGDPKRPGEKAVPTSLSALESRTAGFRLDEKASEADRRLALANWLVASDNPLVPRVLANRLWHYHFGCGLVDTPSDFGYMGGRPTHPELLDYLAGRLLAGGWRLKPLHRLIMTSQTYRQSSAWRAAPARLDADSRLLWRYPPRRLEAEELRDALLAVSGSLQRQLGGPGFRLYEYQVDNVATYQPLDVQGPETYRRGVYHQNARASRVDLLGEFDCPDNSFSAPRRASTTTPLQSLTLLNHSFVLDMASALAARLESERPSDERAQVERAFWLAMGRSPEREELDAATKLVDQHGLRAFCRAIFNASEFVYVR